MLLGLVVLWAVSLQAQTSQPAPAAASTPRTTSRATPRPSATKELEKRIDEQAAAIEAQQMLIEQQACDVEDLSKQLAEMQQALAELGARLKAAEAEKSAALTESEARLKEIEVSLRKKPELPPEAVSAGDFPGSFKVPGSRAAIKIGGIVRASVVQTFDALGSDDRFLTYSIPIEGTAEAGKGPRLSLGAGGSKLSFDVRSPTELGQMRAFIEGDFAGTSSGFRLRHAYGQTSSFLVGQTWSTFSDPDADHLDIDFEGVNAENVQRQAQVRYFRKLKDGRRFGVAIEYPTASITGGKAVNQVPDFVGRMVWPLSMGGHLQASAVIRQIRGELEVQPNVVKSALAWGLSASGVISVPAWSTGDRLIFQVNAGRGIARYINDLNSAGGQDAIFTDEGELRPLGAYAFYVDYEHVWGTKSWFGLTMNDLRSSLIWGHVDELNLKEQPGDAYHRTDRVILNFLWSPIPSVDLGTEILWGRRENKDGSSGMARQLQLRMRFLF
ncbi:MAG: porin [Thermoanaerobaculaceae bacterium]|nr:porin [Thermoanaerobaculaceae bacterium]